ncbi:leucine-rich PPR motif-containing protein, mitochondrial [Lepeophtheirus salmonis]|uniref:leucine-rich PPR motif-containing protein, mitochondrial n=1 Tax=Lepeophtheirus salmonis TaxID=72036 RepID=UPI001AE77C99|nr:leucine-rich PPR motif-containing protein, mitochondrial-like [Lepeophtheirus salmonis]
MLGAFLRLRKAILPLRSPFLSSIRNISHEERLYQTDIYLKRNGRISIDSFHEISKAPKITPDRALLLFRCCGMLLPDELPMKRHEMMLNLKSKFKPPFLDISHANTQLLVQNENGIPFNPSEALAEIESIGLVPNRVTYQHLIECYASSGDVESANAILAHMKEAGMPVNEWIFGSLITAHCLSGNYEGAKSVMEVMKTSGLEVGNEAHTTYIIGVLKNRAKDISGLELSRLFEDAKLKEISFCDHDIFQVLKSASDLNRIDLADEIISYLPRKSGYYQEMRNHIPSLIFNGHLSVALDLFQDFASNIQKDDTGLSMRVAGEFIPLAMVRSGGKYSAKEIEEAIDGLVTNDVGFIFSDTLVTCIEEGYTSLSKELGNIMQARKLFDRRHFIPYIRRKTRSIVDSGGNLLHDMGDFISKLITNNIFPSMQSYSQDILPPIISNRTSMDGRTIHAVRDLLTAVKDRCGRIPPYSDLGNAAVQHHLNLEKENSFKEALRMLSNIRTEWVLPISWKMSLARSYLVSNNLDYLTAFFFFCLREQLKTGELADRNATIWDTIPLIHSFAPRYIQNKDPDLVLKDVLSHLSSAKILPPKNVAKLWKRTIEDPSVLQLIDDLSEPQQWSKIEDEQMNETIFTKIFHKNVTEPMLLGSESKGKEIHVSLIKSIAEDKFVEGADMILKVMKPQGFVVAPREVHDLILGLCLDNKSEKALEIFNAAMEQDRAKVFAATAAHLLGHLLTKDEDSVWKNFLHNSVQFDKLISKQGVRIDEYFSSLTLHLDEESKKIKLDEVKTILEEKGVVSSKFNFLEEGNERTIYRLHSTIVDLIDRNKVDEAYNAFNAGIKEVGVIYAGTCIQMAGALAKHSDPSNVLKHFLTSLSEDKIHARQPWNAFVVSLLNHIVDHLEDLSKGYTLLEDLYEDGFVPSKICKAYYNTKVGLLIKENKIEEALALLLEAGEQDVLVKNQDMMKIFAEKEDLESLQKVLDVSIGILGEVNALYSLIRCFLDLKKFPQVKKLLETPGFRYVSSNVQNLVEYLIRSENINGLEHFVNSSRNLFGCDRDYLFSKLLSSVSKENQGEKASEIWINLQEEGHIPSPALKAYIANALRSAGKYVPFSEASELVSDLEGSSKRRKIENSPVYNPILKSLIDSKDDSKASFDLIFSLEESERNDLLSSKQGISAFAYILKNSNSEDLISYESLLSDDLNKLFFIARRKMKALIAERKVDIVDSIRENPDSIPSVKIVSEVADADSLRELYNLKDNFSDTGKAIVVTSAFIKGNFSLVKEFISSSEKNDRSFIHFKRYIHGNIDCIPDVEEFLDSLKKEDLIMDLGGPIYSYLLEKTHALSTSRDKISNFILELSKNKVDLRNMSTSALKVCANHCEDEVMKKNIIGLLSERTKKASLAR